MKIIKKTVGILLNPPWITVLALVILCTAGLVYVFTHAMDQSFLAYCLYPVSAYTTCVTVYYLVRWGLYIYHRIRSVEWLQPYFNDREYRKLVSMGQGLLVSLFFALFKLTLSMIYHTIWEMAVGIYYLVLCLIRTNLMRVAKKAMHEKDYDRTRTEWINYLRTGIFMFVLNATMSGMAVLMIWQNQGNSYPGFVIYVSAFHAFYALINACVQMFRFRKSGRPVFYSVNAVNLAGALMSIFILQIGLLQMFAEPGLFTMMMNAMTATAVLASVFALAVLMVVQGIKELQRNKL